MGTRATITVADENDRFDIYQHYDGYPDGEHGLVRRLSNAPRMAWKLPRFEAMDFAAAVVSVLKEGGGTTYLTKDAELHSDRAFHYKITPVRDGISTRVGLCVTETAWQNDTPDKVLFDGDLMDAVQKFDATPPIITAPRELQMLGPIEGALYRAEEEIGQWFKGTPDPDTQGVLEDLDDAGRLMCNLRHHLEKSDPWAALKQAEALLAKQESGTSKNPNGLARTHIRLALEAHQRFQR